MLGKRANRKLTHFPFSDSLPGYWVFFQPPRLALPPKSCILTPMPEKTDDKPSVTLPATVEKVIKPLFPSEPEKAQITVHAAEDLYKEIRVDNTLTDEHGKPVKLKPGAHVQVTIEADPKDTTPAPPETSHQKK
jgi:hypothetical protein